MNGAEIEQRASLEIERRLDALCSSEEARSKMLALALAFGSAAQQLGSGPSEQQAAAVLLSAATYLKTSLKRSDLDGKVLLETVNSLCWEKRYEEGEALPETLLSEFEETAPSAPQMLHLWQKSVEQGYDLPMTKLLMWWTVATLVSEAVHLEEDEALLMLEPLLSALGTTDAAPSQPPN